MAHREWHRSERIGWLRAAVLGANDGVISTASLMVGVAATGSTPSAVLTAGLAGLVAGAMSMAAGEYVSVQSQADTERADIARETRELETQPELEHAELAAIYRKRGLDRELAQRVADQLMAKDALAAHVRDELGITETLRARPVQAALASAASFAAGAVIPIVATLATAGRSSTVTIVTTLVSLLALGGLAGYAGGSPVGKGAFRVAFWGALAMALTAGIGRLFGSVPL
ncbi:VIT family protein [Lysobacter yangpyeongensis]|uniref:VIT family protein n=1 Tax=Lysobacter yangpyeongensis TaxID=346182 RepID=A0ABW0SJD9_9GAMM